MRVVSDADLDALAARLYHLPLALELAGRYLAGHRRLAVADYLAQLADVWTHPSMARWREDLGSPTAHDLSLAATFALSWERVKAARRLFPMAGFCAPKRPIPCAALEAAAGLEQGACDEALGVLTGLGLLEQESAEGPLIHPLLAEYARCQEGAGGVLAPQAAALAREAKAANDRMDQTGSLAHFAPLAPHVRAVAESAEAQGLEDAASLWNSLGYYLHRAADYAGARAAFARALAILEKFLPPDHPRIEAVRRNLKGVG